MGRSVDHRKRRYFIYKVVSPGMYSTCFYLTESGLWGEFDEAMLWTTFDYVHEKAKKLAEDSLKFEDTKLHVINIGGVWVEPDSLFSQIIVSDISKMAIDWGDK